MDGKDKRKRGLQPRPRRRSWQAVRMKIEAATNADLPRLLEVWESAVRATHHFLEEADIQMFRPLVRDGYLPSAERLAVARAGDGQPRGFVGVEAGKVEMLFVDPAYHGTGAGKALLRHAVESWGANRVDVNEQNPGAVGFYLHMGFELESRSERDGLGKPFPLLHLRLSEGRTETVGRKTR
jgi:putative acetyltransferase